MFTEHDAVRHVTRGAFTGYDSFLTAVLADRHTGGWWHAHGMLTFCSCPTDGCTPECRDGRQRPPGFSNRWHNTQSDYTISHVHSTEYRACVQVWQRPGAWGETHDM